MTSPPANPLRYNSALERPEQDEARSISALVDSILKIARIVFKNSGHARRGVHAKGHALIVGEATIPSDLPDVLKQGLFATPGVYPCVLRFSTIPGDMLDDSIQVPRGLGLKIVGVQGERLPEFPGDVTQDFLFANGPVFGASKLEQFSGLLKLLAATTDWPQAIKKFGSTLTRSVEAVLERLGAPNPLLQTLGGYPSTNVVGDDYFTQAPLRFGDYVAKLQMTPVSPALRATKERLLDLRGPDALRAAANDFMTSNAAEWELRAQLAIDPQTTPIENPAVEWPQAKSAYVTVARIHAEPQIAWSDAKSEAAEDVISFNPWRGLAAHQPLGAVMRARRKIYAASTAHRISANRVELLDPRTAADLPRG